MVQHSFSSRSQEPLKLLLYEVEQQKIDLYSINYGQRL